MKYFRQFMAMPAMALCAAMLTFSACNDDSTEGGGPPAISLQTAAASRAGIAIPVSVRNADNIHYAVLLKAADATTDPTPEPSDYKTVAVSDLADKTLLIPAAELKGLGTYCIYTYVSNSQTQTQPAMTTVSYTEDKFEDLLKFEIKNVSAFSLDVKVDANAICDKYVVTVIRKGAYNEIDFIDMALRSISPDEAQLLDGVQSYKVFSQSATVPEAQLVKNTKYDTDVCEGFIPLYKEHGSTEVIKYKAAIYAIDKFGNGSVYTSEDFELPEPAYNAGPAVEIAIQMTYTKISASFTAPENCAKVVYGSVPAISDAPGGAWDAIWASNETAIEYLKTVPMAYSPITYTGKQTDLYEMKVVGKPGERLVVYAIGVTADGKIGSITYEIGTLQQPNLTGAATIKSLTVIKKDFDLRLFWDVVFSSGTTAMRFFVTDKDRFNSLYAGTPAKEKELEWIMCTNESPDGYGEWKEYTVAQLEQTNFVFNTGDLSFPDTEYVIRAVARDATGKWGPIYVGPDQRTKKETIPEEDPDKPFDYTKGTGIVTVEGFSQEETNPAGPGYDAAYTMSYKFIKGANTREVYTMMNTVGVAGITSASDITLEKVTEIVNKRVTQGNDMSLQKQNFDEVITANEMEAINTWGANMIVIVSKDQALNYKIIGVLTPNHAPIMF